MVRSTSLLAAASLASRAAALFDLDSSSNAVAICYSVWQSLGYDDGAPPDISEIEQGHGSYAGQGAWHWWGRPDGGYYAGGDRAVLDRHFEQISGAGIDFIVVDATNLQGNGGYAAGLFTEPSDALLSEMKGQRAAGKTTPHVVFWVRTGAGDADPAAVGQFVHDRYYANSDYDDLWVTYGGKPFLLTTDTLPDSLSDLFTMRKMWGLQSSLAEGEWSFLQDAPQNVGQSGGVVEEVSVCTAKQAGYMTDKSSATPRDEGKTFQTQWQRAFDVHPKVVMLTWWNEWMAQRQADDASGNVQFVDNYDGEYSRDIEPQDPSQPGGHGSKYLDWTTEYIKAYKANQAMPGGLTGY